MATLAIGTDTDGSVRVPAGFNGLVCLKTTRCRISLQGVTPLRPTLDTIGSIERTVSNAALMYRRMQVPDPSVDQNPCVGPLAGYACSGQCDRVGIGSGQSSVSA